MKTALKIFKPYPVLVLADREFHSPKLALWLSQRQVEFVLRQKKGAYIQLPTEIDYQPLKIREFAPSQKGFLSDVYWGKRDQLGPFNLAFYWKRQYRGKGGKDSWFIMTSLPTLEQALSLYACRWGIEMMFKDCKSGGYNLEQTKVNDVRFLASRSGDDDALLLGDCRRLWTEKIESQPLCRSAQGALSPETSTQ